MRRQIVREKAGVRACYDDMLSYTQKPVHKKMPTLDILNLVKKEVIDIAIHVIDCLKNVIQLCGINLGKHFVVKVNISESGSGILHGLPTDNGLSRPPHAHNRLCHVTVDIDFLHWRTLKNFLGLKAFKFQLLFLYDLSQISAHCKFPLSPRLLYVEIVAFSGVLLQ